MKVVVVVFVGVALIAMIIALKCLELSRNTRWHADVNGHAGPSRGTPPAI